MFPRFERCALTRGATHIGRSDRYLVRDEARGPQVRLARPPRRARGGTGRQHYTHRVPAFRAVYQRDAARALRAAQRQRGRREADRLEVGVGRAPSGVR